MLGHRLWQAPLWRRPFVCQFCAVRGHSHPFQSRSLSVTAALAKEAKTESTPKTTSKREPDPNTRSRRKRRSVSGTRHVRLGASPAAQPVLERGELATDLPGLEHGRDDDAAVDEVGQGGKAKGARRKAKQNDVVDASMSLKEAMIGTKSQRKSKKPRDQDRENLPIHFLFPDDLKFEPIDVKIPPVPMLSYGLDRVLFNPGIYLLQDPRSRVYNFDPYLEKIMPVHEFDFDALSEYKTSSKDQDLLNLTREAGSKFTGSTSSMSGVLQHFHFLLSNFRTLNHNMLSREYPEPSPKFSKITYAPSAVFLRYKDGVYAIDADKSFDSPNIMSWLGHSLEKLLTTKRTEFERYRRSSPDRAPTEDNSSRCYHYSKQGNFLMRSQLDAVDPRLPGSGVFDLKTRAVVSIRMNHKEYEKGSGYQLRKSRGEWESFEREFYDMTRATLLKYSLQVRMGRMDGIFIAFHNVERIFGFQYLGLSDMDAVLHGQHDTQLGNQEFKLSIALLDELLSRATAQFPDTSLRLHFEARDVKTPFMYIFAEPVTEEQADELQATGEAAQKKFARTVVGVGKDDSEVQAAWQDIQDEVDEQVDEDRNGETVAEDQAEENELSSDGDTVVESSLEHTAVQQDDIIGDHEDPAEHLVEPETHPSADAAAVKNNDPVALTAEQGDQEMIIHDEKMPAVHDGTDIHAEEANDLEAGFSTDETPMTNNSAENAIEESITPEIAASTEHAPANDGVHDHIIKESIDSGSAGNIGRAPVANDVQDKPAAESATLEGAARPEDVPKPAEAKKGPLMGWTLTIRNKVNGEYVSRPEQLEQQDEWKIEYHIQEISEATRWKLYGSVVYRRQQLVGLDNKAVNKGLHQYRELIQRYSARGREWRIEQDKMDEGKVVELYRPLGPGSEAMSLQAESAQEAQGVQGASPSSQDA